MRTAIKSDHAPKAIGPYSQGISTPVGQLIFLSGQIPLDPATGNLVEGDISIQTQRCISNIQALLKAAGVGMEHVAKSTIFLMDLNDFAKVNEIYARAFDGEPPARSTVQVAGLPKGARVEIEVIAVKA